MILYTLIMHQFFNTSDPESRAHPACFDCTNVVSHRVGFDIVYEAFVYTCDINTHDIFSDRTQASRSWVFKCRRDEVPFWHEQQANPAPLGY